MNANLVNETFGARFLGIRYPAWQELGLIQDGSLTCEQALVDQGLDHKFVTSSLGYRLPNGHFRSDKTRKVILREPTADRPDYDVMGVVSEDYAFLQNLEIAKGIDLISDRTGWKLETLGTLKDGGTFFASLNAGTRSVFGDEYKQCFLVSDGKGTNRALRVSVIPYRLVCTNGLMAVDHSSLVSVQLRHDKGIVDQFQFWMGLIPSLTKARESAFVALETMASVKISDEQAQAIIDRAYPLPKPNQKTRMIETIRKEDLDAEASQAMVEALSKGNYWSQWALEGKMNNRAAAFQLYQRFNDGAEQGGQLPKRVLEKVAHTPYAALQAVSELADWGGKERSDSQGRIARDALFGERARAKELAWNAALTAATSGLN